MLHLSKEKSVIKNIATWRTRSIFLKSEKNNNVHETEKSIIVDGLFRTVILKEKILVYIW